MKLKQAAKKTALAAAYLVLSVFFVSALISLPNGETDLLPFIPLWVMVTTFYFIWKEK